MRNCSIQIRMHELLNPNLARGFTCFQRGMAPGRQPEVGTWSEYGFSYSTMLVLHFPTLTSALDTSKAIPRRLLSSPTRDFSCFQRGAAPGRRPEVGTWSEFGFSYSTKLVLHFPTLTSTLDTSNSICRRLLSSPTRNFSRFRGAWSLGVNLKLGHGRDVVFPTQPCQFYIFRL